MDGAIRLDDILSETNVLSAKETNDRSIVEGISTPNLPSLREKLVEWAIGGFSGPCVILEVSIRPPPKCLDGTIRNLPEYILYLSGKTIYEHMAILQTYLPDFTVEFVDMGSAIHFRAIRFN